MAVRLIRGSGDLSAKDKFGPDRTEAGSSASGSSIFSEAFSSNRLLVFLRWRLKGLGYDFWSSSSSSSSSSTKQLLCETHSEMTSYSDYT